MNVPLNSRKRRSEHSRCCHGNAPDKKKKKKKKKKILHFKLFFLFPFFDLQSKYAHRQWNVKLVCHRPTSSCLWAPVGVVFAVCFTCWTISWRESLHWLAVQLSKTVLRGQVKSRGHTHFFWLFQFVFLCDEYRLLPPTGMESYIRSRRCKVC